MMSNSDVYESSVDIFLVRVLPLNMSVKKDEFLIEMGPNNSIFSMN